MLRRTFQHGNFLKSFTVRFCSADAVTKTKPVNLVGQAYQDVIHRGRGNLKVGVRELKKIMKLCGPGQARYAATAVDWFQKKRYDFNEELNSIFIKVCINDSQLELATTRLLSKEGRIGAWTTATSLNRLLNALLEKGDAETMANLLTTLVSKGVHINALSVELCLDASYRAGNRNTYEKVLSVARGRLGEQSLKELTDKYPAPTEDTAGSASTVPAETP